MSSKPRTPPPKRTRKSPERRTSPRLLSAPTDSERAFEAALVALRARVRGRPGADPEPPTAQEPALPGRDEFVDRIFAQRDAYLHDPYASIGEASSFHTKVAGVTFEGRQDVAGGLRVGDALSLEREPGNSHDPKAIAIRFGALHVGYVRRGIAVHLAPAMDAGVAYRARVASLTGGGEFSRGVNLYVERDPETTLARHDRDRAGVRANWDGDIRRVQQALIGEARPHEAQRAVLERVETGVNTLAVLGTGRGKSFCFALTAAVRALKAGAKTLVLYPLRALANDQYAGLMRTLDPLGLRIYRANGSIDASERDELFEALREGAWDLVLATPEFLDFHRDAFVGVSRPEFLVIDEAHHLHESRRRPAYAHLAATIATLGNPQVLALTATARAETFAAMTGALGIAAWVIDPTVRENLHVVDARNTRDKVAYLQQIFGGSGKGIVYCSSRRDCAEIANRLRATLGNEVGFYHAGMPTKERQEVERWFREGGIRVVVATSAFGEGIDLPDVRDVVLYHLNFHLAEFNQQAGRAGRDGADARIHLLFGQSDRSLNDYLIDTEAPSLAVLRKLYAGMRGLAHQGMLHKSNADIAATLDLDRVRDRTVAAGLRIFSDAGLIELLEDDRGRAIRFLRVDGKVNLERNERFAEGLAIRESFADLCALALEADANTLERIVNRPIYPSGVPLRT